LHEPEDVPIWIRGCDELCIGLSEVLYNKARDAVAYKEHASEKTWPFERTRAPSEENQKRAQKEPF